MLGSLLPELGKRGQLSRLLERVLCKGREENLAQIFILVSVEQRLRDPCEVACSPVIAHHNDIVRNLPPLSTTA